MTRTHVRKIIPAAIAALLLAGCSTAVDKPQAASSPSVSAVASQAPDPKAESSPTVEEAPVAETTIAVQFADLASLPVVNVPTAETILASLSVDPEPFTEPTTWRLSVTEPVPIYREPGGPAIGLLDRVTIGAPTQVPVLKFHPRDSAWAQVPVMSRAGLVSAAAGQAVGWVHLQDNPGLVASESSVVVRVSLSKRTLEITDGDSTLFSEGGIGIGAPTTPTPVGRTALTSSWVNPVSTYTEGLPIFGTASFSAAKDSFVPSGSSVSAPLLIAFHFHSERDGAVSNGCIRVSEAALTKLGELAPPGTPVMVTP